MQLFLKKLGFFLLDKLHCFDNSWVTVTLL